MGDDLAASEFKRSFIARTVYAREKAGYATQEAIAEALGIKQAKYHKYESRSLMPHYLVPKFCLLCEVTTQWMFMAAIEVKTETKKRRRRSAKAKKAA